MKSLIKKHIIDKLLVPMTLLTVCVIIKKTISFTSLLAPSTRLKFYALLCTLYVLFHRYVAEILPIRRKTLLTQSTIYLLCSSGM